MLEKDFEKFMKENLESAKLSWDKELMWNDIELELEPAQESKRAFPLYIILGLIFCVSIATLYFFNAENNDSNQSALKNKERTQDVKKDSKIVTLENSQLQKKEQVSADDLDFKNKQTVLSTKKGINKKEKTSIKSNNQENSKGEVLEEKERRTLKIIQKANTNFQTSSNDFAQNIKKVISQDQLNLENNSQKPQNSLLNLLSKLERIDFVLNNDNASNETLSFYPTIIEPIEKSQKKLNKFQIGLYTQYSLPGKRLSPISSSNNITSRNSSEAPLEGLSAGLNLEYDLTKNLFVNVGIDYTRVTERLDFLEDRIVESTTVSDSAFYFTKPDGTVSFIPGENTTAKRTVNQFRVYNTYESYTLPVLIGYKTNLYNKIEAALYAGPVLNLYQNFNGSYVDDEGLISPAQKIEKTNLINNLQFGLRFSWCIKEKMSIYSGLNYGMSFNKFSIDRSNEQSYNLFGLKIGFLYTI